MLDRWLSRLPEFLRRPVLVGFAAAITVALITLAIPNSYQSDGRILPADQRSSMGAGGLAAAAAAVGVSIPGQDSADSAYVDILNSYWLRSSLLQTTFEFKDRAWRFGAERPRKETLLAFLEQKNLDRGLRKLKSMITVNRDLKTKLISISVETTSPQLSQQIVQRMIGLLDTFIVERSQTKGGNKAKFSDQRLKEAREDMIKAETDFRNFLEVNRNYQVSPDPSVRLKGGRLEAELRLRQQLVTTLALTFEQSLLEEKNDMPILNVLDAGNLPIEKSGPKRSIIVLITLILAGAGTWAYENRAWIRQQLVSQPESESIPADGSKTSV